MSKHTSTASIEWWWVSNSSNRPDRKTEKKIAVCLWFSQVKISKLCAETKFYWFSKMYRTCFLRQDFLSFFRLTSLVSHHPEFLEIIFYKKNSALFLFSVVNYSQLCSFRPMHTQFRSTLHDLKSFDYVKKQFYCLHRIVVGLKFKLPTRQNKESEKGHIF